MNGYWDFLLRADKNLGESLIEKVSVPSIVMVREENQDQLKISALNPDLNMPHFEDRTKSGMSCPVELTFTIDGNWELVKGAEVKSIATEDVKTNITVENQDGFPKVFQLKKEKK